VTSNAVRWGIVVAAAVLVIGLAAYGRGAKHHRGDEIGSHGTRVVVVRTGGG
jgi:GH18 family chitinase